MLALILVLAALAEPEPQLPARYLPAVHAAMPELFDPAKTRAPPPLVLVSELALPGRTILLLSVEFPSHVPKAHLVSVLPDGKLGRHLEAGGGRPKLLAGDWSLSETQIGLSIRLGDEGDSQIRRQVVVSEGTELFLALDLAQEVRCEAEFRCYGEKSIELAPLKSRANGLLELAGTTESFVTTPDKTDTNSAKTLYRWDGHRYRPAAELRDPLVKSAAATSTLLEKGMPAGFYAAPNAVDGVPETAWVEGVKGPGVGEALTLTLKKPTRLKGLSVLAGCGVTAALWRKNHRIKTLLVSLDGQPATRLELEDLDRPQRFPLQASGPAQTVRLEIGAVYPGSAFDDACLSEVRLEEG